MKRVEIRQPDSTAPPEKTKIIETPWLRTSEAAAYCGLSQRSFNRLVARHIPHGKCGDTPRYHVTVLDQYLSGAIITQPQELPKKKPVRRARHLGPEGLRDSVTGKIHLDRKYIP